MKSSRIVLSILLLFGSFLSVADTFKLTKQPPNLAFKINTNANDLCQVASNTLSYLKLGSEYDPSVIHAQKLQRFGITPNDIMNTLKSLCEIAQKDAHSNLNRLSDLAFLTREFDFYRITSDVDHAQQLSSNKPLLINLTSDKVLMTKYYVHLAKGSLTRTAEESFALHALPYDEQSMSLEQAELKKHLLTRFQYGKQIILDGALDDKDLAPVLVYLSREDLESALLQGTVVVEIDGKQQVYNVHRNNGVDYDRQISPYQQERYWYFKHVNGILGYGKDANHKIEVIPEVTFAGDIYQLGLGPLVFAQFNFANHSEYRMAIMADTGGAFQNNLYQLDYLAGSYPGRDAYYNANKHMPDYINAWFMVKKRQNELSYKSSDN